MFLDQGKKYSPSRDTTILPKIWKIVKLVPSSSIQFENPIHNRLEAVARRCSAKTVFLEIS